MPSYFFPSSDPELMLWSNNYKTNIANHAGVLQLSPQEVAEEQQCCDEMIAAIQEVVALKASLKAAIKKRKQVIATKGGKLKMRINQHKTNDNYTKSLGRSLNIITPKRKLDLENYKAQITVGISGGLIQVKFVKKLAHGINLYYRAKKENEWQLVSRVTKSPFTHAVTLKTAGQPETFEYRATGVVNDKEIGTPSDIAVIVYAG
jgi:hypothetical protein